MTQVSCSLPALARLSQVLRRVSCACMTPSTAVRMHAALTGRPWHHNPCLILKLAGHAGRDSTMAEHLCASSAVLQMRPPELLGRFPGSAHGSCAAAAGGSRALFAAGAAVLRAEAAGWCCLQPWLAGTGILGIAAPQDCKGWAQDAARAGRHAVASAWCSAAAGGWSAVPCTTATHLTGTDVSKKLLHDRLRE